MFLVVNDEFSVLIIKVDYEYLFVWVYRVLYEEVIFIYVVLFGKLFLKFVFNNNN